MIRRLFIGVLVVIALLVGGVAAIGAWAWTQARVDTAGKVEFTNPLAIPPLAESRIDADGRRVFDLTAAPGLHDFGAGPVDTRGFTGDYLGPTLRARRGEQVAVNVRNELDEPTTVHWHGMHLPAVMDGGPHQTVAPGATWTPTWQVDQPAATLWYHPHPHGQTETHVYRGLAGMFILDDDATDALDLPDEYGVDDIPVIVQDKRLDSAGRLDERRSFLSDSQLLGDTVVVNGTVAPYLDVTTELVRLRLLNGSTARSYNIGFDDGRTFNLIATDGGLLAEPHPTISVMLSPGERAEIVVAMAPGDEAVLRSHQPDLGVGMFGRFFGADDTLDILQLRAADDLAPRPDLPERLADVPRLDPAEAADVRSFRLSGRTINGERMDMNRIDAVVQAGSVEVWQVRNADGVPHNFHIHDVQFQVLTVDGGPPPPELAGWKDTIFLPPNVQFELIARHSDYADPDTPYMFHCHLLAHEDAGMMGQFVVVDDPGAHPGRIGDEPAHRRHGLSGSGQLVERVELSPPVGGDNDGVLGGHVDRAVRTDGHRVRLNAHVAPGGPAGSPVGAVVHRAVRADAVQLVAAGPVHQHQQRRVGQHLEGSPSVAAELRACLRGDQHDGAVVRADRHVGQRELAEPLPTGPVGAEHQLAADAVVAVHDVVLGVESMEVDVAQQRQWCPAFAQVGALDQTEVAGQVSAVTPRMSAG